MNICKTTEKLYQLNSGTFGQSYCVRKTAEEIGEGLESRQGEQKCQIPQPNFRLHSASLPGCQYTAGKLWLSQTLLNNAEKKLSV